MRHRAALSGLLVALVAFAAGTSVPAPAAAGDKGKTTVDPPTLLWKSYPLKPNRPGRAESEQTGAPRRRAVAAETPGRGTARLRPGTLALVAWFVLGAALLVWLVPLNAAALRRGLAGRIRPKRRFR